MKIASKNKKEKKEELINSRITLKNTDFKFIEEINEIIRMTIKKVMNKIFKNELYQNERIKKVIIFKKELLFYNLIIILLASTIFIANFQNSIIYRYSFITLKVSQNGEQKIFNSGTSPNQVLIDDIQQDNKDNPKTSEATTTAMAPA